ncbi:MAG: DUF4004 family protein [Clostridia bacterium]|nr:DUF4004 family protein [Clostridia bacterium]
MDDLISKKEVLEKYNISYGALYRWKRMGLIPEEWFVKKSAVTGQETYFVREAICERIETILGLKDSLSLDEIADQLKKSERQSEHMLEIIWSGGKVNIPLESIVSLGIVDSYGEERREESEKLRCVLAGIIKKGNN